MLESRFFGWTGMTGSGNPTPDRRAGQRRAFVSKFVGPHGRAAAIYVSVSR
jgi:hypothetical protein